MQWLPVSQQMPAVDQCYCCMATGSQSARNQTRYPTEKLRENILMAEIQQFLLQKGGNERYSATSGRPSRQSFSALITSDSP